MSTTVVDFDVRKYESLTINLLADGKNVGEINVTLDGGIHIACGNAELIFYSDAIEDARNEGATVDFTEAETIQEELLSILNSHFDIDKDAALANHPTDEGRAITLSLLLPSEESKDEFEAYLDDVFPELEDDIILDGDDISIPELAKHIAGKYAAMIEPDEDFSDQHVVKQTLMQRVLEEEFNVDLTVLDEKPDTPMGEFISGDEQSNFMDTIAVEFDITFTMDETFALFEKLTVDEAATFICDRYISEHDK